MRCYASKLALLSLLLALSSGQEWKVPVVAIQGTIVEVDAPLQLVAETDVQDFRWLEGGRYLVYLREAHPGMESYAATPGNSSLMQRKRENALYLYDTTARRASLLHRNNIDFWEVALKGRAVLYAVSEKAIRQGEPGQPPRTDEIVSARMTLYLRLPHQSQPKVVAQFDEQWAVFDLSPEGRYLAIHASKLQLLDLQTGRIIRNFEEPFSYCQWASESLAYLTRYRKGRDPEFLMYDLRTDKLQPISQAAYEQAMAQLAVADRRAYPVATRNLQLRPESQPGDSQIPAAQLKLLSHGAQTERFRSTVVAHDSDAQLYSLAPDESGIAYRSWRGQLFYIPLSKRDPRTLSEKLACGQKLTQQDIRDYYLSNGKQIAMAALMYCQDYDELFPPNDNITNLLMPYIKNPEVFQDLFTGQMIFTYLLDGQSLGNIENIVETPLGRLDWGDPEVIVVLYADGHVKLERRK